MKNEYDLVILFSGGADSRLMLELALVNNMKPLCILIGYGQIHGQELEFAQKQLNSISVDYKEVSITLPVVSGLTGGGESGTFEGVHEMFVPSRNLIFIGIAASIAESRGINKIWYGPDYDDYINRFPDCYQEWVGKVNEVLKINGHMEVNLEAPLLGMTKEFILDTLENVFNVNLSELFSGYGDL